LIFHFLIREKREDGRRHDGSHVVFHARDVENSKANAGIFIGAALMLLFSLWLVRITGVAKTQEEVETMPVPEFAGIPE
jgi:hypothetical protein